LIRFLNAYFPKRTLLLGVSEACLVASAFLIATVVRVGASDANVLFHYEQGFLKIFVVCTTLIACMHYFDLYDSSIVSNRREVASRLVQVFGTACIVLACLYYFYPPLELGRGIFLGGFVLAAIVVVLWRRAFLVYNSQSQLAARTMVLGAGPLAAPVMHELQSRPELGLRLVSHVLAVGNRQLDCGGGEATSARPETLTCDEFEDDIKAHRVNRVIVTMGDRRGTLPVELLLSLKSRGLVVQDGADFYEAVTGKVPIESLRLSWLLFSPGFHVSRFLVIYKRLASILVSIVGLLLSLPFFPFIALAIKLTSSGPLFYMQRRVGRDDAIFHCYKFRTMRADAEADIGATWAADNDPRITRVGKFIRKARLDEIPQLWNVLKGEMSLIGPRPERPEFVDWLASEVPLYRLRNTVRPGITGWAQIRYEYGNSVEDAKEKLRYDLFYIKNMSPGLDLLVFLQTIKIILLGRGAK
jgi:sugar transferase (PEP-CTERM system associated)